MAAVSSSQMRHSLLDWTVYSLPLYSNTGPVVFMSRSRLRSQAAFDGANQSVISSAFVVGLCFTATIAWPKICSSGR